MDDEEDEPVAYHRWKDEYGHSVNVFQQADSSSPTVELNSYCAKSNTARETLLARRVLLLARLLEASLDVWGRRDDDEAAELFVEVTEALDLKEGDHWARLYPTKAVTSA